MRYGWKFLPIFGNRNRKTMPMLKFPASSGTDRRPEVPNARQFTIIGGSGSGKSKFMEELMRLNSPDVYCLDALSAPYPERGECERPGSIDMLFREAAEKQPYMRTDAVSELDKLTYMLFIDEFESLLALKEESRHREGGLSPNRQSHGSIRNSETRLDILSRVWTRLFPGHRIVKKSGRLLFATASGSDLIGVDALSQGEKTVLYYVAAVLYAMPNAVIFIDSPSLFLHPSIMASFWNTVEELRSDCVFVYNSVDVEFVGSRSQNACVWVKSYDAESSGWDYEIIRPSEMREEMFVDLIGTRRPVLFVEGDASHSIDSRLYPLVFPEYTVRPLGSCDKVIESTRSFNTLRTLHHLESKGIVDRDRRTDHEVEYLRAKSIMVPDVAEVENLFLLEGVVKGMARLRGCNPDRVFEKVRTYIVCCFAGMCDEQALEHVRHRVKREAECRIDARFNCITAMEIHLRNMAEILKPRAKFNEVQSEFRQMVKSKDYDGILRVFNHKPMIGDCGIAKMLKYKNKDEYVAGVISTLRESGGEAEHIRHAIARCFHATEEESPARRKKHNKNTPPNV